MRAIFNLYGQLVCFVDNRGDLLIAGKTEPEKLHRESERVHQRSDKDAA